MKLMTEPHGVSILYEASEFLMEREQLQGESYRLLDMAVVEIEHAIREGLDGADEIQTFVRQLSITPTLSPVKELVQELGALLCGKPIEEGKNG